MKKIVSLMALCAVLFGAVVMVAGCGSKPEKGTVWKVTKETVDEQAQTVGEVYYCFHTDGNAYQAMKDEKGNLYSGEGVPYTMDTKAKKLTMNGLDFNYTISGNNMTLKFTDHGKATVIEMQKSSDYTEAQIKKAVTPKK